MGCMFTLAKCAYCSALSRRISIFRVLLTYGTPAWTRVALGSGDAQPRCSEMMPATRRNPSVQERPPGSSRPGPGCRSIRTALRRLREESELLWRDRRPSWPVGAIEDSGGGATQVFPTPVGAPFISPEPVLSLPVVPPTSCPSFAGSAVNPPEKMVPGLKDLKNLKAVSEVWRFKKVSTESPAGKTFLSRQIESAAIRAEMAIPV